MPYKLIQVFLLFLSCSLTISSESSSYVRARIESCPGCSLNRLKEVKQFIFEDIPKYEGIEFKKIHGAKPELVLFNIDDVEIERLPLSHLNRKECNDLLIAKGLQLKPDMKSEL